VVHLFLLRLCALSGGRFGKYHRFFVHGGVPAESHSLLLAFNVLDVYCPVQCEFSLLEIANAILSKRKIPKLTEKVIFTGWSDPRLHTLPALRDAVTRLRPSMIFVKESG
jgi:glutamyl/glutaminyl-tRNA synthetase